MTPVSDATLAELRTLVLNEYKSGTYWETVLPKMRAILSPMETEPRVLLNDHGVYATLGDNARSFQHYLVFTKTGDSRGDVALGPLLTNFVDARDQERVATELIALTEGRILARAETGAVEPHWWCDKCQTEVSPVCVRYNETHDREGCGNVVRWVEHVPALAVEEGMVRAERYRIVLEQVQHMFAVNSCIGRSPNPPSVEFLRDTRIWMDELDAAITAVLKQAGEEIYEKMIERAGNVLARRFGMFDVTEIEEITKAILTAALSGAAR